MNGIFFFKFIRVARHLVPMFRILMKSLVIHMLPHAILPLYLRWLLVVLRKHLLDFLISNVCLLIIGFVVFELF